jgi:hypothetical protein
MCKLSGVVGHLLLCEARGAAKRGLGCDFECNMFVYVYDEVYGWCGLGGGGGERERERER